MDSLENRIGRLERQNRIWRVVAVATGLLCCGIFLLGQAAPTGKTIEAQKFVLLNDKGQKVGEWKS